MHETVFFISRSPVLSFDVLYVQIFKIYANEYLNRDIVVYLKYDVKFT